ncbi:DUF7269 family protein [Haloarcula amylovorans]|uniref:DUF7269 family protein n=1 Tax=Haloarcula amylovorans TaxID=2562280 RepID=UPI001FD727A1|nr:hypothetical protein [Halomicroarcula amylolytica]
MSRTETVSEEPSADEFGSAESPTDGKTTAERAIRGTLTDRATVDATVERADAGPLWRVLTLAGLAALAAAVVVATVPGLLPTPTDSTATATLRAAAPYAGAAVALVGLYGVISREKTGEPTPETPVELPSANPETMRGESHSVVGDDIDDLLRRIDGRVDPYNGIEASYAVEVQHRLREAVLRALVRYTDRDPETAEAAVANGTWTDDVRAASFLGDRVGDPPLAVQLRDWASGEGFDRKVAATLSEIRRLRGGDAR